MQKRELKKKILTIAKKMNICTVDDIEILTGCLHFEVEKMLYEFTQKGVLEKKNDCYIYTPTTLEKEKAIKENLKIQEDLLINDKPFPFKPIIPREVYFRKITDIEGYNNYFFASASTKARIQKMMQIMREVHGLDSYEREIALKKFKVSPKTFNNYRREFLRNGFKNVPTLGGKATPPEVYFFFKEFYLSYRRYTMEEARKLAIEKFKKLYNLKAIDRKVEPAKVLYRRVLREYSKTEIKKYRMANFSEFDLDEFIKH